MMRKKIERGKVFQVEREDKQAPLLESKVKDKQWGGDDEESA